MRSRYVRLMSVIAIVAIMAAPLPAAGQASLQGPQPPFVAADSGAQVEAAETIDLSEAVRTEDGLVRVIVELSDPALAVYSGGIAGLAPTSPEALGTPKLDAASAASQAYISHLKAVQAAFVQELAQAAPSAKMDYSYQVALNAVSGAMAEQDAYRVAKMKGVKQVYPDRMNTVTLDVSLDLINAPEMWLDLGGQSNAGSGVYVAVVDSGIRPENPMFDDAGFAPPTTPATGTVSYNYCTAGDPAFVCNDKLWVARYYTPTFPVAVEEVNSPLDIDGHGTHTASTSAGRQVVADPGDGITETISGVAPMAYVGAYKGLFEVPDHSSSSGTDSMLLAALNDAVLDGADVINNSWGGSAGGDPNTSVYNTVLANIVAAGTLPVFSAGNSGPGANTIGCPGCVESAFTVAASTTSRVHANTVDVTGPGTVPPELTGLAAPQGDGPAITSTITAEIDYAGVVDPGNELGCDAFPADAFDGKIALMVRGSCNFSVKVDNAADAGAIAAIVHNNVGGPPNVMGALSSTTIPSVSLTKADGEALAAWIETNPGATAAINEDVSRIVNTDWEDILAGFSSAGPNGDPDVLKPDITAPGVNILAGFSPVLSGGNTFSFLSGTSMSAPHITGAAALMKDLHPGWSPDQIKTALTSTSVQDGLLKSDGATPADPFNIGAGRVDLNLARQAALTFDKPSAADGNCVIGCAWTRVLRNESGSTAIWSAVVDEPAGVDISVAPSTVTLGPGATATVTIAASLSTAALEAWHFGSVTWQAQSSSAPDAYMPLAIYASSASDAGTFTKWASADVVHPNEIYSYTLQVANNSPVSNTFILTDTVPDHTTYVPGTATGGLVYDSGSDSLSAAITLDGINVQVITNANGPAYLDLTPFAPTNLCSLTAQCDETTINLTFGAGTYFEYLGQTYTNLRLYSNGFFVPGGSGAISGTPWINQDMPNPADPDNVIAAWWTDLDMDGTSASDLGSGSWLFAELEDINTGQVYAVVEYQQAALYEDPDTVPGPNYTFQIWIEYNSPNAWFVYQDFTGDTSTASVGVENFDGSVGDTYYYNGTGTLPITGTPSLTYIGVVNTANLTFDVQVDAGTPEGTQITNIATLTTVGSTPDAVAVANTLVALWRQWLPWINRN